MLNSNVMKYIFALLLLLHGIIHTLGFTHAYELAKVPLFSKAITRTTGVLWLIAALLFLLSCIFFLQQKSYWAITALAAVLLSQILIIFFWKEAKAGTIANLLILLVAVPAFADYLYTNKFLQKAAALRLADAQSLPPNFRTPQQMPPIVQQWLQQSGINNNSKIKFVHLHQRGQMKTKPGSSWQTFTAEQFFTTANPSFIWKVRLNQSAFLFLSGCDEYADGKGSMQIKLYSLFTVMQSSGEQTDQGSMIRYLAELCWFPSAALHPSITWQQTGNRTAVANFTHNGKTVQGNFTFNEQGDIVLFETHRYYQHENKFSLERWEVKCMAHKTFEGIRIPTRSDVSWKLKDGTFNWLQLEISDIGFTFTQQ